MKKTRRRRWRLSFFIFSSFDLDRNPNRKEASRVPIAPLARQLCPILSASAMRVIAAGSVSARQVSATTKTTAERATTKAPFARRAATAVSPPPDPSPPSASSPSYLSAQPRQQRTLLLPPYALVAAAVRRAATATAASTLSAVLLAASPSPPPAFAAFASAPEKVADFAASGILFRDAVEVTALEDPDVKGATIFIADFKRSLTAKLAKDFFSEPSQASITCAADPNTPLRVVNAGAVRSPGGTELFSERKGLSLVANKTLRVRRVFDEKRSTLLYVSYSTRLSDDADTASTRYRTSVCALPLPAEAFNSGGGGARGGVGSS